MWWVLGTIVMSWDNVAVQRELLVAIMQAPLSALPAAVDWRTKGIVTPVKDQGQCGSVRGACLDLLHSLLFVNCVDGCFVQCYAFSVTEEIESRWAQAGNPLVALSAQQIVSCDKTNYGCYGGDTIRAIEYVMNASMETNATYPYT